MGKLGFAILLASLVGLGILRPDIGWTQTKEVVIGVAHPLSGPSARFGIVLKNGWEMGVEEINAAGGIKSLGGAKMKLAFGDVVNKPDLAASEIERLIKEYNPVMVAGCMASSLTMVATQIAEKNRVPFLVDNATAPGITKRGFKYTFRCTQHSIACATTAFDFVEKVAQEGKKKPIKVAMIYEDTDYGIPYGEEIKKVAKNYNWEIVADERFPSGTADLTLTVNKVKLRNPDVVFCVGYINDIILLGRTIQSQKFQPKAIIHFGGASSMPDFMKALGKGAEYWYTGVAFAVDMKNPYNQKFVEKYNSRFKELPNENAHNGYIAAYVAKEVLELAASADREKVRDAFTRVHITDGPGAGEGQIKFDPDGELSNPQGILTQNLGGKPVTVWPPDVAASKAVYPMPK